MSLPLKTLREPPEAFQLPVTLSVAEAVPGGGPGFPIASSYGVVAESLNSVLAVAEPKLPVANPNPVEAPCFGGATPGRFTRSRLVRSEEHTSELQSHSF